MASKGYWFPPTPSELCCLQLTYQTTIATMKVKTESQVIKLVNVSFISHRESEKNVFKTSITANKLYSMRDINLIVRHMP